ncbi:uncharacterized protein A4U43_C07F9720 [Asparagus officinalis]|uniref:UspA domain-containing protein n=1 Tax=Asparagus officinalis TaxID=4686 RepID=A0A5P1EAQ5_ASPOF|nr:uncharacterized protein A4U43_C07F9720 [Asparagus officinalis]
MAADRATVMVVGIDDSEHSLYALQWTLLHFFSGSTAASASPFNLIVVHAKPTASSIVRFAGPGAADVAPYVEADLRKTASRVLQKAKDLCVTNSVGGVLLEVIEGDARNVLCEAVEKHQADILVVGSHGYGAIKRHIFDSFHVNSSVN